MRELALSRAVDEREYRNQRRTIVPAFFHERQTVLVRDPEADSNRFRPRWKGPFQLVKRVSDSLWEARTLRRRKCGRQPILRFHVDQLQLFEL